MYGSATSALVPSENLGWPDSSELLELYMDGVYNANIASAAKTTARQRFSGALRRNDRDRDSGGGTREHFKTTRPASRPIIAKDATKDSGLSPLRSTRPNDGVLRRTDPRQVRFEGMSPGAPFR
eukprot:jgi/Tetstr1/464600/TSEL_009355.t1